MSCTLVEKFIRHIRPFAPLLLLFATTALRAQTFRSLLSFDGTDGGLPYYVYLVQGADGQLYGTTNTDGENGYGTVFKITTSGKITTIYSFCALSSCTDGANPYAGLALGTNGNFYGTATSGGYSLGGTIFEITPSGTLTTLYTFCDISGCPNGANPESRLLLASNGNFYGTTTQGGDGDGTVFKITPAGKFTLLHTFNGLDGASPRNGALLQGANGKLYGTTTYGGTNCSSDGGCGTVFEMTLSGTFRTLYNFCSLSRCADGNTPYAGIVLASNGSFYGTTEFGGANGANGTVFEMTTAGHLTTLYSFCVSNGCSDGDAPQAGLIQASDGNLYGTTGAGGAQGGGTIFQITPTGTLTTLYDFCSVGDGNCFDGQGPSGGLQNSCKRDPIRHHLPGWN